MLLLSDKLRAALLCCSFLLEPPLSVLWGGVGWAQPGSGQGRCPPGVLLCEVTGMGRGLRAFPRYCLVLTSPDQPLGAQLGVCSRGSSQQGAGNALLLLWKAKGPAPTLLELRVYLGWVRRTRTHTQDKLTMAHVMPQILKPYATLLFNMADFVRRGGHPLWKSTCSVRGTVAPKGSPTSAAACAPLPALPNPPSSGELSLLCLLL